MKRIGYLRVNMDSSERKVIMVCQDIADSLDNAGRIDIIMADFQRFSV
jgi:hypothetical protein